MGKIYVIIKYIVFMLSKKGFDTQSINDTINKNDRRDA